MFKEIRVLEVKWKNNKKGDCEKYILFDFITFLKINNSYSKINRASKMLYDFSLLETNCAI